MAAVADRAEFLAVLEQSKILDPDRVAALRADAELPPHAGPVAERLVQDGTLTRFQAKQLLAGKYRGLVFGPYLLLDQVGKGGMGTVYLAEHAKLKRKVAIKVLARDLAENKIAVERFQREARAASALCHPNIVRVHHVGSAGGTHYIVMEYVDGATLDQIIDRRGPFTPVQAAKIAAQAAAGLAHAHERGFVHRDIKPENLMLTKAGQVKILDMGLTKNVQRSEDNLTGMMDSRQVLGTLDYLSPEQAMDTGVDARSDLYSLGATLFTLVTGHSPYEGVPAAQKLLQHQSGAVPKLATFRSEVPGELSAVVAGMMAKRPEDRPQSAEAVIEALLPWASEDGDPDDTLVVMPSGVLRPPASRAIGGADTVRDGATDTRTDLPVETPPPAAEPEEVLELTPSLVIGRPARRPQQWVWIAVAAAGAVLVVGGAVWKLMG
jgi:serine/threonine protein kinase